MPVATNLLNFTFRASNLLLTVPRRSSCCDSFQYLWYASIVPTFIADNFAPSYVF